MGGVGGWSGGGAKALTVPQTGGRISSKNTGHCFKIRQRDYFFLTTDSLSIGLVLMPFVILSFSERKQLKWVKWRTGMVLLSGKITLLSIEELRGRLFHGPGKRMKIYKEGDRWEEHEMSMSNVYGVDITVRGGSCLHVLYVLQKLLVWVHNVYLEKNLQVHVASHKKPLAFSNQMFHYCTCLCIPEIAKFSLSKNFCGRLRLRELIARNIFYNA